MPLETREFDAARYLETNEAIEEYLVAASEDGDPQLIAQALGVIARARGMSELSRTTGLPRQSLYKALSGEGNPEFGTIAKVADALGFKISLVTKTSSTQPEDA
ncbi:addiction module antidote protein [Rhizobium panacihumi]|uniref:addiction module antidote protein n=1 Tax=Rhizobium panacihumi TaxID=2008450 RepID=UPI003D7B6965